MSCKLSSYSQPDPKSLKIEEPQRLRPLVPLRRAPQAASTIPTHASVPGIKYGALPGYIRSSHIIPAAFPRTLPRETHLRVTSQFDTSREQRVQAKSLAKALIDAKLALETPEGQAAYRGKSETVMWNCVDRYVQVQPVNTSSTPGITLFVTHANGFPRQIWEPALAHLVSLVVANPASGIRIDEIWSFEAVQHGDSALINVGKQCDTFDWQDHTRDIINFLTCYLPDQSHVGVLPTVLNPVSRENHPRQVMGLGHSFGGATLSLAAITHPKLFQSLILVEPLIVPTSYKRGPMLDRLLLNTLRKPTKWTSRQVARAAFKKHPPTNTWDSAVVDIIMEHEMAHQDQASSSLIEPETNTPIHSKTHPFDEAAVYCDWIVPYEAWTYLVKLDPSIALHWIMSGETNEITGGYSMTQTTVWRRPVNSTNICLPGVGHLIVQESPKTLGAELFRYLQSNRQPHRSKL